MWIGDGRARKNPSAKNPDPPFSFSSRRESRANNSNDTGRRKIRHGGAFFRGFRRQKEEGIGIARDRCILGGARFAEFMAMAKRTFSVKALWDAEAKVYYCESDIDGLHIETATLEAFEEVMFDAAVELIVANHMSPEELATTPLKDLIPAILFERPLEPMAA
jgi:Domain of unknown function (DUF1902)